MMVMGKTSILHRLVIPASVCFGVFLIIAQAAQEAAAETPKFTPEQEAFFESKVRPLLAARCFDCHGEQQQKGNLRLDSREALLKGNESGPVIVPGRPEESQLLKVVGYTESVKMPPREKLANEEIATFRAWVEMGAPFPGGVTTKPAPATDDGIALSQSNHWAYQPIRSHEPPVVQNPAWMTNPVDRFILAQLESAGMTPSPPANRRTLLRRVTIDLTGLPPTAEEVKDFEKDTRPDAFARVVDRLLASPHYGERWGRHWLDVARYADTKGYVFTEEGKYPYSYTYRDYVIRAFNDDLPFDRFVLEQLAADLLPLEDDKRPLAAMGFLTLGRRFGNNMHDIIDDRIDVVTRGLLGLTVACARCHDHKYDPIPTEDYYSLYGIFASSVEPAEPPLIEEPAETDGYRAYKAELDKREAALNQFVEEKRGEMIAELRGQARDYLVSLVKRKTGTEIPTEIELSLKPDEIRGHVLNRWQGYVQGRSKPDDAVFGLWHRFEKLPAENFAEAAAKLVAESFELKTDSLNSRVREAFAQNPPDSLFAVAKTYGDLLQAVNTEWLETQKLGKTGGHGEDTASKTPAVPTALADPAAEELRQVLYAEHSPTALSADEARGLFQRDVRNRYTQLKREVDSWKVTSPDAPPRAMVLNDAPTPRNARVFLRGSPGRPGPEVPRRFLRVLAQGENPKYEQGSGRLQLARAIVSPDNPLTARVIVNRVWQHHFGAGLVQTPSDFGARGTPPTHPELLDYLARSFIDSGWSLKTLHRQLLLSQTYQQQSHDREDYATRDPENRLLWRMNRKRLEFEPMRDALLAVAGKLDRTIGGRPVEMFGDKSSPRRSVYGFIDRQDLPGILRNFDFASPDASTAERPRTTVPQQALFALNSPFVIEQAQHLAARPDVAGTTNAAEQIQTLYRLIYAREPDSLEVDVGLRFLQAPASASESIAPIWQYGVGTYDEAAGHLRRFEPLPHFADGQWKGGPKLPDPKLGWVMLNASGGHAGRNLEHVPVRRWTAPQAGIVRVRATLGHAAEQGDGIRGIIVSSRSGKRGEWLAHHNKVDTNLDAIEVEPGDHLDFIVDCRTNESFDSFTWAPRVELLAPQTGGGESVAGRWDAAKDFGGPPPKPLTRLEQYAQILLLTNEFVFID